MRSAIRSELSKRPIKALDEEDLISGERALMTLKEEATKDKALVEAWSSLSGKAIQSDLLDQQRQLEREAMMIAVTDSIKLAINRGMWKQLDLLISRHIIKKGEMARKEGLVAALLRRTSEMAERLQNKSVKREA
jgi:hypothetical protein